MIEITTESGKQLLAALVDLAHVPKNGEAARVIAAIEKEAREQVEWGWAEIDTQRQHGALVERVRLASAIRLLPRVPYRDIEGSGPTLSDVLALLGEEP